MIDWLRHSTPVHRPALPSRSPLRRNRRVQFVAGCATYVGRRARNEDACTVQDLAGPAARSPADAFRSRRYTDDGVLFLAVADGMGGHVGGDIASGIAVGTGLREVRNLLSVRGLGGSMTEALRRVVETCDRTIRSESERDPTLLGMGTTLTMALVTWPYLHVAHVGDSRCYLFRNNTLIQLTHDHTIAGALAAHGAIDADAIEQSPFAHVLANALGGHENGVKAEMCAVRLHVGDAVLVCSDGLTRGLTQAEIVKLLSAPHATSASLVEAAKAAEVSDNTTVALGWCCPAAG
ncbi:MAG TPA: protein phosphatase 2C domain-containing protein [Gemmatimonadales bacterium]